MVLYYIPSSLEAFISIEYLMLEVEQGWLLRVVHMNGASVIFLFLYSHIFKNMALGRNQLINRWVRGYLIFILLMAIGFIGYSIVWSQIRFWAIVVITSLLRVVPIWGENLVLWVWGGFSVCGGTLRLFFVLHFILPLLVLVSILLHLEILHGTGRRGRGGYKGEVIKVSFSPFFRRKDLINFSWFLVLIIITLLTPFLLSECELFEEVNALNSPVHIVPEWYFCSFYGVLRRIPNKGLGVVGMVLLILELFILTWFVNIKPKVKELLSVSVIFFVICFVTLTWLGGAVANEPFVTMRFVIIVMVFFSLAIIRISRF